MLKLITIMAANSLMAASAADACPSTSLESILDNPPSAIEYICRVPFEEYFSKTWQPLELLLWFKEHLYCYNNIAPSFARLMASTECPTRVADNGSGTLVIVMRNDNSSISVTDCRPDEIEDHPSWKLPAESPDDGEDT